jgi:hypothetical protein
MEKETMGENDIMRNFISFLFTVHYSVDNIKDEWCG